MFLGCAYAHKVPGILIDHNSIQNLKFTVKPKVCMKGLLHRIMRLVKLRPMTFTSLQEFEC